MPALSRTALISQTHIPRISSDQTLLLLFLTSLFVVLCVALCLIFLFCLRVVLVVPQTPFTTSAHARGQKRVVVPFSAPYSRVVFFSYSESLLFFCHFRPPSLSFLGCWDGCESPPYCTFDSSIYRLLALPAPLSQVPYKAFANRVVRPVLFNSPFPS